MTAFASAQATYELRPALKVKRLAILLCRPLHHCEQCRLGDDWHEFALDEQHTLVRAVQLEGFH